MFGLGDFGKLTGSHEIQAKCPMRRVANSAERIKKRTHEVFGKPTLNPNNDLSGVNGKEIVNFLRTIKLDDFDNEGLNEIIFVPFAGLLGPSDPEDIAILSEHEDTPNHMSRLSGILYTTFVMRNKYDTKNREGFYYLVRALFRAYDSILLSGTFLAKDMNEWKGLKDTMIDILINLSQILTDIQERFTCPGLDCIAEYNGNQPYILFEFEMEKLWNEWCEKGDISEILQNFHNEKGAYARCPAARDGTLGEAFTLLFDIYGELLVKPKEF